MFEIGKKVVCVNDDFANPKNMSGLPTEDVTPSPKKHQIIEVFDLREMRGDLFLSFAEFNLLPYKSWFRQSHFRPLEDFPNFQLETVDERIEILSPQTETA